MNVKELKAIIKDLPDNMDVMIQQNNDEYQIGLANEASVVEVSFHDDVNDDDDAEVDCLVIRD